MNLSIFPNGIDTFVEHYDIQPADLPNIRRYQELKQKSYLSVEEQNELSNLTHVLREKIFLADDFNKLQDCITNLETFFRDETQGQLDKLKKDLKNTADKALEDIVQAGEDYISTSRHFYTSWLTTANQRDFNILEGSETITEDVELDFQEEILDLFLNGDMLLPDRDYTFELADNGKKQVIRMSLDISSTMVAGQRVVAKWFQNVGKLYIDHSHEHKTGGKDGLVVDMDMLAEDVRLAIGDTTQVDEIVKELGQVRQDLTTKSDVGHKHTKADITDFPTSLPANGGDADTVDGKHATDFASSSHNHNGTYAPVSHVHGDLAPANHSHSNYAPTSHTHDYSPNNGIASTSEAQSGTNDTKYMTPLKVKQAIQHIAPSVIPSFGGLEWAYVSCHGTSTTSVKPVTVGAFYGDAFATAPTSGGTTFVLKSGKYIILYDAENFRVTEAGGIAIGQGDYYVAYSSISMSVGSFQGSTLDYDGDHSDGTVKISMKAGTGTTSCSSIGVYFIRIGD